MFQKYAALLALKLSGVNATVIIYFLNSIFRVLFSYSLHIFLTMTRTKERIAGRHS